MLHCRWMIRRDYPEVLEIERDSFSNPWSEDDYIHALRQRNCIGRVVESGDRVVGSMVYTIFKRRARLVSIAVHPDFRRHGVGRLLVGKIAMMLRPPRERVVVDVRESNLGAQLFFRNLGFSATKLIRGYYADTGEDGIRMVFRQTAEVV